MCHRRRVALPRTARLAWIAVAVVVVLVGATVVAVRVFGGTSWHEPVSVDALRRDLENTVRDHMAAVPGAAVAVLHGGTVVATVYAGNARDGQPVGPDTVFQTASLSKPVAAFTVLSSGIDVDAPVERSTGTWRFPPSAFDASAVTLRRLLSHTAGVDVGGYLGFDGPDPLPSIGESLAGNAGPASDGGPAAVAVVAAPGSAYSYSGGGYSVAQLALESVQGRPFADSVAVEVAGPLGMTASGFACTTRPGDAEEAVGHDSAGKPTPRYRYPEAAAGGFCSTATDYARFVAALLADTPVTRAMRAPAPATNGHYGLGLELGALGDGTAWFGHLGVNRGWHNLVRAYPGKGWAFVALTDGDGGAAVTDAVEELFTG